MPTKPISPAAYGALSKTLHSIVWYKRDLKNLLRRWAQNAPELLTDLDFDDYKWKTAEEFVDRLQADEARYGELAFNLMVELSEMTSFPELKRHENADELTAEARETVANLKACVGRHRGLIADQARFTDELAAHRATSDHRRSFGERLGELKVEYLRLEAASNRQQAGRQFEKLLNQLFRLFDMEPRLSYELGYEQIDGSLTFDTDDYIIEAKWWKERIEASHLYSFAEKVRRKGWNALGLFISVSGFTEGARQAFREGTRFQTLDGEDLFFVLDARITLDELLRRKKRYANETGSCYYPARLMMGA
jgi:hypothetical protein